MYRTPPPTFRTLRGVTLIELMVIMIVLGLLLAAGAPSYFKGQRYQRLKSAAQQLQGSIAGLRNLALTGVQVRDRDNVPTTPDRYCLEYKETADGAVFQAFTYEDRNGDTEYTPTDALGNLNDDASKHIISPTLLPAPDFAAAYPGVGIHAIYLLGTPDNELVEAAPFIICTEPPNARMTFFDIGTSDYFSPATLVFELVEVSEPDAVLAVSVDSVTGRVTLADGTGPTGAPTP